MSAAKITLKFDGPAVENGEIDVKDLAPPLLAIGELIQAANRQINSDKAKIAVKVTATREGCFEIDLNLVQSLVEMAQNFIDFADDNEDKLAAANDLASLIFNLTSTAIGVGGGLFALLKWLKGQKPDKLEPKGNEVHVHLNGQIFIADQQTINLAENKEVREQAVKAVSTLEHNGINSLSVLSEGDENVKITPDEVPYFDLPEVQDAVLKDELREMTLQIISLSFKEDNKWRVTDGAEPFSAAIEDTDFLKKVANDELSFAKHDYLVCTVREKQMSTTKGLKKELTIEKVIEHKPAPKQMKLM